MRRTIRQLAAVKPSRYLEPGTPTGLTGLFTHSSPRSTLLYLYSNTLDKLRAFPESSLYRQSTEALTKHRISIVSAVVPEGHKEWAERTKKIIKDHPEVFNTPEGSVPHDAENMVKEVFQGKEFVTLQVEPEVAGGREWDGEEGGAELEGVRNEAERASQSDLGMERPGREAKTVNLEPEPALTADQINELETKIGAGLIEEVIQVAEGELKLLDIMLKSEAWQDLEEKPVEGQWDYFKRDTVARDAPPPPPQK